MPKKLFTTMIDVNNILLNTVTDKRHKLGCPYMKLTNLYDIIPLESVVRNVHVVPDFNYNN
jgi:hypothetical protein